MEGKPLGGAGADPRQARQLRDEVVDGGTEHRTIMAVSAESMLRPPRPAATYRRPEPYSPVQLLQFSASHSCLCGQSGGPLPAAACRASTRERETQPRHGGGFLPSPALRADALAAAQKRPRLSFGQCRDRQSDPDRRSGWYRNRDVQDREELLGHPGQPGELRRASVQLRAAPDPDPLGPGPAERTDSVQLQQRRHAHPHHDRLALLLPGGPCSWRRNRKPDVEQPVRIALADREERRHEVRYQDHDHRQARGWRRHRWRDQRHRRPVWSVGGWRRHAHVQGLRAERHQLLWCRQAHEQRHRQW